MFFRMVSIFSLNWTKLTSLKSRTFQPVTWTQLHGGEHFSAQHQAQARVEAETSAKHGYASVPLLYPNIWACTPFHFNFPTPLPLLKWAHQVLVVISVKAHMHKSPWSQGEGAFAELVIWVTLFWVLTLRFQRGMRWSDAGPTSDRVM